MSYTCTLTVIYGTIQSGVCHQYSTSNPLVVPLCVQLFASRASSRCKHDMGQDGLHIFVVKCETLERPTVVSFPGPAQLSVALSTEKRTAIEQRKAGRGLGTRLQKTHFGRLLRCSTHGRSFARPCTVYCNNLNVQTLYIYTNYYSGQ